jgi:hypothetical protein
VKTFWHVSAIVCLVSIASAQTAPIRTGSIEVGGFAGASYGISQAAPMGGGNISYAVYKMLLPYVEYSYFPSIQHTLSGNAGGDTRFPFSAPFSATASDFHGGIHFRVPIPETRLAPYGVFGVGVMTIGQATINTLNYTDQLGAEVAHNVKASTGGSNIAVNFGGGLRYYVSPQWGFRIEVKGYKPFNSAQSNGLGTATLNNVFLKAEAGFFYQFR